MPTLQHQRRRRAALVRAELDEVERRLAVAERGLVVIDLASIEQLRTRAAELRDELERLRG